MLIYADSRGASGCRRWKSSSKPVSTSFTQTLVQLLLQFATAATGAKYTVVDDGMSIPWSMIQWSMIQNT